MYIGICDVCVNIHIHTMHSFLHIYRVFPLEFQVKNGGSSTIKASERIGRDHVKMSMGPVKDHKQCSAF